MTLLVINAVNLFNIFLNIQIKIFIYLEQVYAIRLEIKFESNIRKEIVYPPSINLAGEEFERQNNQ